ncbi:uncharacterized protein LOC135825757 [Sycon ciliatum]|uniref:uncharacterized protein LOC135825757 n=1 Tax=Sycon ciliatum TaxID=27933 RepID=UPI0031F6755C
MASLPQRLFFSTIFVLVSALASNSRSAHHWKLDSDGTIVEVQNKSGSSDPLFVLLNSRCGTEGMTELSPSTLPIPAVHSPLSSDDRVDFSDSRWRSAGDDEGDEDIRITVTTTTAGILGSNALKSSSASKPSLPASSRQATTSASGNGDGDSNQDSSLSTFLLHNQGLSVVDSSGTYFPRNGKLLLNGLSTTDSNADEAGSQTMPVYSQLNLSNPLTCGPPVSSTRYDSLQALKHRDEYPVLQELEVAVIFKKMNSNIINLTAVEIDLQEALSAEAKPSLALLNELGNFWRVQGNTLEAVECFRAALHQQPDNADVLLNLARLLLNMGYVQDARALAHKSLAVASPEHNSWLQHFTLADTYERSGSQEDTIRELSHTLDLNPGFKPAEMLLSHLKLKHHVSGGFDGYLLCTVSIIVLLSGLVLMLLRSLLVQNQATAAQPKPPDTNGASSAAAFSALSSSECCHCAAVSGNGSSNGSNTSSVDKPVLLQQHNHTLERCRPPDVDSTDAETQCVAAAAAAASHSDSSDLDSPDQNMSSLRHRKALYKWISG